MSTSKERTNTGVIETRIDLRVLAALANYADEQGRSPRKQSRFSKAALVQTSLELLHDSLLVNDLLEKVESTVEALARLEELGYGMDNSINKNILKAAISAESIKAVEVLRNPVVAESTQRILEKSD